MNIKNGIKKVAPVGSALVVLGCAVFALKGYEMPTYDDLIPEKIFASVGETESDEIQENNEQQKEKIKKGNFTLDDGKYKGIGVGYKGNIEVEVAIESKSIKDIKVLSSCDDAAFFNRACKVMEDMIARQDWDVDVVTGATYSSKGIKMAVRNALTGEKDERKAVGNTDSKKKPTVVKEAEGKNEYEYKDGTFRGAASGFAGNITVDVTIKKGLIKRIKVVSTSDGASYMNKAKAVINRIIASQSTNVDVSSGATYSSVGIINAVRNALDKAKVKKTGNSAENSENGSNSQTNNQGKNDNNGSSSDNNSQKGNFPYKDGIYYGTGEGFEGEIKVALTIKSRSIKSIKVTESMDDEPFFSRAKVILNKIVETQNIEVDTVSGATFSSRGILEAVANAIKAAEAASNSAENPVSDEDNDSEGDKTDNNSENSNAGNNVPEDSNPGNNDAGNIDAGNGVPGNNAPGISVPENNAPENSVPENNDVGNNVPGNSVPGNNVPENNVPGGNGSENGNPDNNSGNNETGNNSAIVANKYMDGTYTATAVCMPDDDWDFEPYNITVTVMIENDRIVKITNVSADYTDNGNDGYFNWAIKGRRNMAGVPDRVIALTDLSKIATVDVVSNATCSSKGILMACEEAVKKAKNPMAAAITTPYQIQKETNR